MRWSASALQLVAGFAEGVGGVGTATTHRLARSRGGVLAGLAFELGVQLGAGDDDHRSEVSSSHNISTTTAANDPYVSL